MSCTKYDLYKSLEHCRGELKLPGVYSEVYYCPKDNIATLPEVPALSTTSLTLDGAGTIATDITMVADKYFHKIDLLDNASEIKSESQGDVPSKTFTNTLSFKHPSTGAAAIGFCRLANLDDFVYVVRERSGDYKLLGNNMFHTETKPTMESGKAITDEFGTTVEATVTDICPAPVYTGKLVVEGGSIDCSTGTFTAKA